MTASVVYFIGCGRHFKIGTTADLRSRFATIARSRKPEGCHLIGAMRGGFAIERALHHEFAAFALGDEWFTADPLAVRAVDSILQRGRGVWGESAFVLTETHLDARQRYQVEEFTFVQRARERVEELLRLRMAQGLSAGAALEKLSLDLMIPHGLLWALRYRPPTAIGAGFWCILAEAVDGGRS